MQARLRVDQREAKTLTLTRKAAVGVRDWEVNSSVEKGGVGAESEGSLPSVPDPLAFSLP